MDPMKNPEPTPMTPLERARKEYHAASLSMADLDAKVIDASAHLEELKDAFGKAVMRVNAARDSLVDARSPQPPQYPPGGGEDFEVETRARSAQPAAPVIEPGHEITAAGAAATPHPAGLPNGAPA